MAVSESTPEESTPAPARASLFVHVPFCDVRCPYCHFTFFVNRDPELPERWARAIRREFEQLVATRPGLTIPSVYFGGGTPSALDPMARERVCDWLAGPVRERLEPDAEVTIEVNPESAWPETLRPWVDAGVNRMSLGVQSQDEEVLRFLGRLNTSRSNLRALDLACSMVENVSADLIVASPPDRWDRLHRSLEAIASRPISHVSAYLLEIHDSTRFGRDVKAGRWSPSPDESQVHLYLKMAEWLQSRGFAAYELSNFAQPGRASRHNQRYWTREAYLGLGPSASSFEGDRRWTNEPDTRTWCAGVAAVGTAIVEEERLDWRAVRRERILLGLRTAGGIPLAWIEGRDALCRELLGAGLLEADQGQVRCTVEGWLLLDQIVAQLVD